MRSPVNTTVDVVLGWIWALGSLATLGCLAAITDSELADPHAAAAVSAPDAEPASTV